MIKRIMGLGLVTGMLLGMAALAAPRPKADKPVLVVDVFTLKADAPWPYDRPSLQRRIIAAMQKKYGDKVEVVDKAPAGAKVYTLDAIITKNYNQHATDMNAGISTDMEICEMLVTFTDPNGKKILDAKKKTWEAPGDPQAIPDTASAGPLAGQVTNDIVGLVAGTKAF